MDAAHLVIIYFDPTVHRILLSCDLSSAKSHLGPDGIGIVRTRSDLPKPDLSDPGRSEPAPRAAAPERAPRTIRLKSDLSTGLSDRLGFIGVVVKEVKVSAVAM